MDYKKLIERLEETYWSGSSGPSSRDIHPIICDEAATAITDLLARAEAAEKRAEQAEYERDKAVETIFKWTGCPECKYWDSATDWCEKHGRYATMSDGCTTPEWRGMKEE